ncbi:MAG TPA: hypothetical protein VHN37_06365 [Actinomycetota bacterium]|nr:hypothetical protein [Actinomycetota bacterium]
MGNDEDEQLLQSALAVLRNYLPGQWSADFQPTAVAGGTDAVLVLTGGSSNATFIVEARSRLSPKEIEDTFGAPSFRRLRAHGRQRVIVIAPYLSRRARDLLTAEDICYIDLTGNVRIVHEYPSVWVEKDGAARDPAAKPRPARGLRGAAAGKIVRGLIDVRPPYGVTELARVLRVDAGYATRVLEALDAEALIERGRRGRVMDADWESLLRRRAETLDLLSPRGAETYVAPSDISMALGVLEASGRKDVMISGSTAASRLAPVAPAALLVLYSMDREGLAADLDLVAVSEGANVALIRPQNTAPFLNAGSFPPFTFAAPSQIAIDCLSGNGRMPAEGEAVIEWMKRDVERWRLTSLDEVRWPRWVQP